MTRADRYDMPSLVKECSDCAEHWFAHSMGLVHAFASVGIEYNKSAWEMAESYFSVYHARKHRA